MRDLTVIFGVVTAGWRAVSVKNVSDTPRSSRKHFISKTRYAVESLISNRRTFCGGSTKHVHHTSRNSIEENNSLPHLFMIYFLIFTDARDSFKPARVSRIIRSVWFNIFKKRSYAVLRYFHIKPRRFDFTLSSTTVQSLWRTYIVILLYCYKRGKTFRIHSSPYYIHDLIIFRPIIRIPTPSWLETNKYKHPLPPS